MSLDSALSGDTYSTLVRSGRVPPAAIASPISRSSAHRNAASVLPDPVGAEISACSPVAIAGQACDWAAVGSAKARVNQSRTWGVNADSDIPPGYGPATAS